MVFRWGCYGLDQRSAQSGPRAKTFNASRERIFLIMKDGKNLSVYKLLIILEYHISYCRTLSTSIIILWIEGIIIMVELEDKFLLSNTNIVSP